MTAHPPTSPLPPQAIALAVGSAAGGVGKSLVAVQIALRLAQEAPTLLIDLTPVFGTDWLYLRQQRPAAGLDLLIDPDGGSHVPIEQVLVDAGPAQGLRLLDTANTWIQPGEPAEKRLDDLLTRLASSCTYLVLDCPTGTDWLTRFACQRAAGVFILTSPEKPALEATGRLLRDAFVPPDKTLVVVNRVSPAGMAKKDEDYLSPLAEWLALPTGRLFRLPEDPHALIEFWQTWERSPGQLLAGRLGNAIWDLVEEHVPRRKEMP